MPILTRLLCTLDRTEATTAKALLDFTTDRWGNPYSGASAAWTGSCSEGDSRTTS